MELDFAKLYNMSNLSYQYHGRLSNGDKVVLKQASLLPGVNILALKISELYELSLYKSIRLALKYMDDYLSWGQFNSHLYTHKYIKPERLEKEFIHQGFVKLTIINSNIENTIEKGLKTLKLPLNKAYIVSHVIENNIYLLPKKYGHSYSDLLEGDIYIYKIFHYYGVQGYTRLLVNNND